ncbi:Phosphohistidine phosphatase SixA [Vibrio ruber DSM 16370]|uniref:Phosphohistidine phosphatase SixA n=1 Tax=Vibrio ruber (strain DSM 16370 / JCM 11486 / BCRC 17186 / CECT 7878 / LMG 23124 / VR1) TaxID=1123498 RepID=A0A1R4LE80_VIBR1|nr:phosphohistidine phosphatase SixA [Vibrio ruber]SJN54729.1 Phosphohistidine phosphatase SixA [Vibrio ruber DSM 16370]
MKIFIMRHGEAGYCATGDADRPLTGLGKSESVSVMKQANDIQKISVDKVLISPYLRAQETWREIAAYVEARSITTCDDITPYGKSDRVFDYLMALADIERVNSFFLVSHLPLVGYLTSEFVRDMPAPMFPTSGLACLDYVPETQKGELLWRLAPK